MRILFILEYYHPHIGGVETLFKQLVDQLASTGNHITIVTNRYHRDLPSRESSPGIEIYRYSFYNRYVFTFLAWIPAVFKAARCDLIHTTSYNAAVPARIAAILCRKKSVITFHELWGSLWFELPWMSKIARRLHYIFEKLITRLRFTRFVAVSDYTLHRLIEAGIDPKKTIRIYNGIDYTRIQPVPGERKLEGEFTVTFFGRLSYSKGIDVLINALGILLKESVQVKLNLVISREFPDLLLKVKQQIAGNQVEGLVQIFHDLPYEQLHKVIVSSHAVVIPSYSEGFCFAAIETMALGVPIISSGRGALKEVLSGRYVECAELSSRSLADAISRAVNGEWINKPVRRFHLQETVNEYIQLYKKILAAS